MIFEFFSLRGDVFSRKNDVVDLGWILTLTYF